MENNSNNTMDITSTKQKKPLNRLKVGLWLSIFIIVILLVIIIVPYLSKINRRGMNYKLVCDYAIVEKYNNTFSSPNNMMKEVVALSKEIKNKTGYEKDPTCIQITYTSSVIEEDMKSAKKDFDLMKKMNEKGVRPDMRLLQVNTIPSVGAFLNQSSENNVLEETNGRG